MPRISHTRSGGFSLLELVVVLVVAGILTAAVMLRTASTAERGATTEADMLRRDLAHIQQLAMGWGVALRLSVDASGAGYTVTCRTALGAAPCGAVGDIPVDPATGLGFSVALIDNVLLAPASNTVDFDSLGRPMSGGTLVTTNPARTYTLTGGTRTATVTLLPITGFAATSY